MMWNCPVCDRKNTEPVCPDCGYAPSADLTRAPTFCKPSRLPPAPSALRAERQARQAWTCETELEQKLHRRLVEAYRAQIGAVIARPDCGYGELLECIRQFCDLPWMGDLWEIVFRAAKDIASARARSAISEAYDGADAAGAHTPIYRALVEYREFFRQIRKLEQIPAFERDQLIETLARDVAQTIREWALEYDRQFRRSFDPKRIKAYEQFYTKEFPGLWALRYGRHLLEMYQAAGQGDLQTLMVFTYGGYTILRYERSGRGTLEQELLAPASQEEQKLIEKSLYSYWTDSEAVRSNQWMLDVIRQYNWNRSEENGKRFREMDTLSLRFWENAARLQGVSMVWLMLEKQSVLLRSDMLERSLSLNGPFWKAEVIERVIADCDRCIKEGRTEAREVRRILEREQRGRAVSFKQAVQARKEREKQNARLRKRAK